MAPFISSPLGFQLSTSQGLSSLSMDSAIRLLEWRAMLEEPSLTLVHLNMCVSDNLAPDDIPKLNFPRLKCLKIWTTGDRFPPWMTIPSSVLIMISNPMTSLPSISTLWLLAELKDNTELSARCPILSELRIDMIGSSDRTKSVLKELPSMLRQRKQNAEAVMEIDGVRMVSLKTLTFDMDKIKPSVIQELKDLVEEVVDLRTVPRVLKIEI